MKLFVPLASFISLATALSHSNHATYIALRARSEQLQPRGSSPRGFPFGRSSSPAPSTSVGSGQSPAGSSGESPTGNSGQNPTWLAAGRSRSPNPDRASNSRSVSPTGRLNVHALGPADIHTTLDGHPNNKSPELGRSADIQGTYRYMMTALTKGQGTSRGHSGLSSQPMSIEAKGKNVLASIEPPPGKRGNVKVEKQGSPTRNYGMLGPSTAGDVIGYNVWSDRPGGAKVTASSENGGHIEVIGFARDRSDVPQSILEKSEPK